MGVLAERISRALIKLGQIIPAPLRVALTQSPAAAWLRRLSLLPLTKGQVVVVLGEPLAGLRMCLDMRSGHRRYALGTYEPEICALIQSRLRGGETVLDIGANIGYFTLLMARRVGPSGRVIAFEPVPSVYGVLNENLRLNGCDWALAECMAVAEVEGEGTMLVEANNPLSFTGQLSECGDMTVPLVTIDRYMERSGLEKLDFAKIDVEGAETRVLQGMTSTLRRWRPRILVEIHARDGQESETLLRLKEIGYRLSRLEAKDWMPCDTRARGGMCWPNGLN
jgi:FkbM family methyltransferase